MGFEVPTGRAPVSHALVSLTCGLTAVTLVKVAREGLEALTCIVDGEIARRSMGFHWLEWVSQRARGRRNGGIILSKIPTFRALVSHALVIVCLTGPLTAITLVKVANEWLCTFTLIVDGAVVGCSPRHLTCTSDVPYSSTTLVFPARFITITIISISSNKNLKSLFS